MLNWFKPKDWTPVWAKTDTLIFEHRNRQISTGRILDTWNSKVDVLIEISYSESRNEYKLQISSSDAKLSKHYQEAIEKLNELRGRNIDNK